MYKLWSNVQFAKLFFKYFLPKPILDAVDLETLDTTGTSVVSEKGRKQIGDVFYKVNLKQGEQTILVILIEHKSTPDRFVAVQMLRYEAMILDHMANELEHFQTGQGKLPAPFSLLLCQNERPQLEQLLQRIDGIEYGSRSLFCFRNLVNKPLPMVATFLGDLRGGYITSRVHMTQIG